MKADSIRHLVFRVEVVEEIGELLSELGGRFALWLFCETSEEAAGPDLVQRGVDRMIPKERWLFSPADFSGERRATLASWLISRTGAQPGELLLIDDRSLVTSAVIRAGVNAVAYVDPFRLRRNLQLRGIFK